MDDDKCFSDFSFVETFSGFDVAFWAKEFVPAKKLRKKIAINIFILNLVFKLLKP